MVKSEDNFATEKFVFKTVQEASDSILSGMDKMFSNLKEMIGKNHEEMLSELSHINHQVSDLKHDTPTIKEFNKLRNDLDGHVINHL